MGMRGGRGGAVPTSVYRTSCCLLAPLFLSVFPCNLSVYTHVPCNLSVYTHVHCIDIHMCIVQFNKGAFIYSSVIYTDEM